MRKATGYCRKAEEPEEGGNDLSGNEIVRAKKSTYNTLLDYTLPLDIEPAHKMSTYITLLDYTSPFDI